jgi:hypothetical protein
MTPPSVGVAVQGRLIASLGHHYLLRDGFNQAC